MKVKEIIKLAEAEGWTFKRMNGDHRIYVKQGHRPLVIPGNLNADIPKGTEGSIKRSLKS
ncbi:MAG: type II toxin-antitoxin system HicA family toxin [Bacteroidaceae bacterium]|nr:type II toxin-antitoxin system HicA family toxin [Bacteroidaceae bacterium]